MDEACVEITKSIPTNLSQVPVFHGSSATKSPRAPYSSTFVVSHDQRLGDEKWYLGPRAGGAGSIRDRITKLENFWATVFCCLIAHLLNWRSFFKSPILEVNLHCLIAQKSWNVLREIFKSLGSATTAVGGQGDNWKNAGALEPDSRHSGEIWNAPKILKNTTELALLCI